MVADEKDTSVEEGWWFEHLAKKTMKALKANNFDVEYVVNRKEALPKVIERIPPGATIGNGDSVTLHQIGFFEWLHQQKDHEVVDPFTVMPASFPDDYAKFRIERFKLQQKALTANVFVTGTNALTLDGKIVSIDGHGNRVAAMCFGPNKLIVVAGVNKIVKDFDEAIKRVKEYAAPINAKRHVDKHNHHQLEKIPCVVTGTCSYCNHESKGCRIWVAIDGWTPFLHGPTEHQPSIIIVGESLGI